MKNKSVSSRLISLFLLIMVVLSACGGAGEGPNVIGDDAQAPVVPAFMAGLDQNGLNEYLKWWRNNQQTMGAVTRIPMQPACGLQYAYEKMSPNWGANLNAEGFPVSSGWLLATPDDTTQFFMTDTEAVIILQGRAFASGGGDPTCRYPTQKELVYVPIRLSLSSGQWQVDGASSVGAVVTISVQAGVRSQPLTSGMELSEDEPEFYSPFRMARFRVTEENHERVQQWAKVSKVQASPVRRLVWFRMSDVHPVFQTMANQSGNRTAPYFAFYGADGAVDQNNDTLLTWLDDWGRQAGDGEQVSSDLGDSGSNKGWSQVRDILQNMTNPSNNLPDLRKQLKARLEEMGAVTGSAPPAELGGWNFDPNKVFAIISSNGKNSYDHTRDALEKEGDVPQTRWLPYAGYVGPTGEERSITITSSQTAQDLGLTDEEFYEQTSFLNPTGTGRQLQYAVFSTNSQTASGTDGGLLFDQAPLTKFNITVTDALRGENQGTYLSDWIPTQFIGREGPDGSYRRSYNLIFEPGQALNAFILDLLYNAYTSTFGAGVSALSRFNTGSLLAVPTLDRFEVDYYGPNGPVYKGTIDPDASNACAQRAAAGGGSNPETSPECFSENGLYTMWFFIRAIMMLFVIAYMAWYFINQMAGWRQNRLQPLGFLLRVGISFALLLALDSIIKGMAIITAEVILITNMIGTTINGGEPYSYLWLFSGFLDTPARDYSILLMAVVALFAIVGLIVLALFILLRLLFVVIMIVMSPIWIYSLITDPEMRWFYSSLRLTLRMYLIPLITLTMILAFFAVMQIFGIGPSSPPILLAFISVGLITALAPVAWMGAHWVVKGPMTAVRAAMDNASKAADESEANAWLGGPANRGSVALAEGMNSRTSGRATSTETEKRELESRTSTDEASRAPAGSVEQERLGTGAAGPGGSGSGSHGEAGGRISGGGEAPRQLEGGSDLPSRPRAKALSLFGDAVLGMTGGGLSSSAFALRGSIGLAEREIRRKESALGAVQAAADRGEPGAAEKLQELNADLERSKQHLRGLKARLSGQPYDEPATAAPAGAEQLSMFGADGETSEQTTNNKENSQKKRGRLARVGRIAVGGGGAYARGLTSFGLAAGAYSKKVVFQDVANLRHEFGAPGTEMLNALRAGRLVDTGWDESSGAGRFMARVTSPRITTSQVGGYFGAPKSGQKPEAKPEPKTQSTAEDTKETLGALGKPGEF